MKIFKLEMSKRYVNKRIIQLAKEFADRAEFSPSANQADRDAACELLGQLQALFSYIAEEKKNLGTP